MKEKQKIFFLHILKTAGSSLISIIEKEYKKKEFYHHRREKADAIFKLNSAEKEKMKIVAGHRVFDVNKHFDKNVQYITLLRNPVDRVISLYYFIKRNPQNRFHEKIKNISLKDYILNSNTFTGPSNAQTWNIASLTGDVSRHNITIKTYEKAIENINKHCLVVGLTERFDESILLMKNELNWSYPFYVKKNVAKKNKKPNEISDEIKGLIAERNVFDIKLYNYATAIFEAKINENKAKIEKQLKILTFLNSLYKPYQAAKDSIRKRILNF